MYLNVISSETTKGYKIELALFLIHIPLKILCFGMTLHYGKSKGMIVIDNEGDITGELKQELVIKLQERIKLEA